MFETTINKKDISTNYKELNISISKDKIKLFMNNICNKKNDKKYTLEIKEYKEKRSLSANGLCWVLCQKIADVINSSKDEVYETMIKRYAPFIIYPVWEEILDDLLLNFKYYEVENARYHKDGRAICDVKVYKGSSNYDTKEMSKFINSIIDECKLLDIDVMDQNEVDSLIKSWGC